MKTVTVKRWIALSAVDHLTIEVPDDWDVEQGDVYDHRIISETRDIIDSTDSGAWELEAEPDECPAGGPHRAVPDSDENSDVRTFSSKTFHCDECGVSLPAAETL